MKLYSVAFALTAVAGLVTAAPVDQTRSEVLARAKNQYKRHLAAGNIEAQKLGKRQAEQNITDKDILNFALQLEYLESQFYTRATTGQGLDASLINGTGNAGTVLNNAGSRVPFQSPLVQQFAEQLAYDETGHVKALRQILGADAVAMPALNLDTVFTDSAKAAGYLGSNATFDPYASDLSFLVAANLFENVGVTAYNGALTQFTSKSNLAAAGSIEPVEAFHAAGISALLLANGNNAAVQAANLAATLEAQASTGLNTTANITFSNGNARIANVDLSGLAFTKTPQGVLNIVFVGNSSHTSGGFFPSGFNGKINTAVSPSS